MIATGTATSGMIADRQLCRNTSTTMATKMTAANSVSHDFVDRFADERRRVEAQCRSAGPRESSWPSSSILSRTRSAVSRALAYGNWNTPIFAQGWPSSSFSTSSFCAPSSTRPMSLIRTIRPSAVRLTTIFSNCSGSTNRPSVLSVIWVILALADRLLADLAAGHLRILLAHGVGHVAGIQVHAGQPVGIDPNAHAVVFGAEGDHVADAVDARQLVLQMDQTVVRDVQAVVAIVGRRERDDHQNVGRALARRHADLIHHVRQQRQRQVRRGSAPSTWAKFNSTPGLNVTCSLYEPSLLQLLDM